MEVNRIGIISLAAEFDGVPYAILIPRDKKDLFFDLLGTLYEDKRIAVSELPEGYKLLELPVGGKK